MKNSLKIWTSALLTIALIFIISSIAGLWGNGVVIGEHENQQDNSAEVGLWTSGTKIEQTFIASQDNLCRVDFYIDSFHPWDVPYLDCYLFEIMTEDIPYDLSYTCITSHMTQIRYTRLNGWGISGHMFNACPFAPIEDSQNKRYLLSIQAPVIKHGGSSILMASSRERYDYGNLFINEEPMPRDLAFRALYQHRRLDVIQQSIERLALQKPALFSSPVSYYGLFIGYVMLLVGLLFIILWQKDDT